jgi:hypothetical protein
MYNRVGEVREQVKFCVQGKQRRFEAKCLVRGELN